MLAEGKPSQWPMVVFSAEHHKGRVRLMVFSPDESTFASISFGILCVCGSETGHCISGPFSSADYVIDPSLYTSFQDDVG